MKDKDFRDPKVENFVDEHTTPANPPPGHLPFESDLPEHSNRRDNIPEEISNENSTEDSKNEDAKIFPHKNK